MTTQTTINQAPMTVRTPWGFSTWVVGRSAWLTRCDPIPADALWGRSVANAILGVWPYYCRADGHEYHH